MEHIGAKQAEAAAAEVPDDALTVEDALADFEVGEDEVENVLYAGACSNNFT